jgi:hypothetical protein
MTTPTKESLYVQARQSSRLKLVWTEQKYTFFIVDNTKNKIEEAVRNVQGVKHD